MKHFYASPNGSGTGLSQESPADLLTVKQLVRDNSNLDNVTARLFGGIYDLSSGGLEFTEADSGKNGFKVLWRALPGEHPVWSGGKRIEGWTLHDAIKNIWKAPVPVGATSRQFFVNGEVKDRVVSFTNAVDIAEISADAVTWVHYHTDLLPEATKSYARPQDVEFIWRANQFSNVRSKVQSVTHNGQDTYYTMAPSLKAYHDAMEWVYAEFQHREGRVPDNILYAENAYEYFRVESKGQWYLNAGENIIYYVPEDGQDMQTIDAYLPMVSSLIFNPIHSQLKDIKFIGIKLINTKMDDDPSIYEGLYHPYEGGYFQRWQSMKISGVESDWESYQWEPHHTFADWPAYDTYERVTPPSCITLHNSQEVQFIQTDVQNAWAGVHFERLSRSCSLLGSEVSHTSGTGVIVGTCKEVSNYHYYKGYIPPSWVVDDIVVRSNRVHHTGKETTAASIDHISFASNCTTRNNWVHDGSYMGIKHQHRSSGDTTVTHSLNTHHNLVHDVMQGHNPGKLLGGTYLVLGDGGGIYSSGSQPNSFIHDNFIFNVGITPSNFGLRYVAQPLYEDDFISGNQVYRNVILKNKAGGPADWALHKLNFFPDIGPSLLFDNFFEEGFTINVMYGIGGSRIYNNVAISSDPELWPGLVKQIIAEAKPELLISSEDIIEGEVIVFGWKEPEEVVQLTTTDGTISNYEEVDDLRWRADITGITEEGLLVTAESPTRQASLIIGDLPDITPPTTNISIPAGRYAKNTLIELTADPDESEPVTIYYRWNP